MGSRTGRGRGFSGNAASGQGCGNGGRARMTVEATDAALVVERDVMIAARDGVRLATDIYRPQGSGPFPVILERTPYDKTAPSRAELTAADIAGGAPPRSRTAVAAYFAGHGYAVAVQDCRGRYRSQ